MNRCLKVSHKTYIRAMKAAHAMKCKGKLPANSSFRAYYCKSCSAWHFTTETIHQYESNLIKHERKRIKGITK